MIKCAGCLHYLMLPVYRLAYAQTFSAVFQTYMPLTWLSYQERQSNKVHCAPTCINWR